MLDKNYYDVLGLAPTCALKDIKKSYHKLALVWHPDKHNDKSEAQNKFIEINEAYNILADNKKRKIYDTCGQAGLDMDQDLQDFADCNQANFFFQKGFQGTDKSAFDVLRDIFEESDDEDEDDFFDDCNLFDLSDNFKTNIKAFVEDNLMASSESEGETFFKNYTPTFMDADFFCQPPSLFEQIIPNGDCVGETEYFTFLIDDDMENYSRTSTTFINNNKVKTSTKQRMQKGNTIYEEEYLEFSDLGPRPSKKAKNGKNKYTEEVIIDEEDFYEILGKNKNKNNQRKPKKQGKNVEGGCKLGGRVHTELYEDELEDGVQYNKKSNKKSKGKV